MISPLKMLKWFRSHFHAGVLFPAGFLLALIGLLALPVTMSARYAQLSPAHKLSVIDHIAATATKPARKTAMFRLSKSFCFLLVPGGGVEPPRPCDRRILSPHLDLLKLRILFVHMHLQLTGNEGR
jgi:hypothetical protein